MGKEVLLYACAAALLEEATASTPLRLRALLVAVTLRLRRIALLGYSTPAPRGAARAGPSLPLRHVALGEGPPCPRVPAPFRGQDGCPAPGVVVRLGPACSCRSSLVPAGTRRLGASSPSF